MAQKPGKSGQKYVGYQEDIINGMTSTVKIILDARVFGLIEEDQNCEGWLAEGVLALQDKVASAWDKSGFIPSRLPDELRERHARIYKQAIEEARANGWDPDREIEEKHR